MDALIGKYAKKLKEGFQNTIFNFAKYFKRLLFPLYLFPIKILTYSAFYIVKSFIKFILAFLGLIWDIFVFPFKSLKNFLKSIVIAGVSIYLFASLFVIVDYLNNQYGWWVKFGCAFGTRDKLKNSVVRIVGGYSEGSGFFVEPDKVITNFHVVADEPSPKIIFPDGKFVTPINILGNEDADLAILTTKEKFPNLVYTLPDKYGLREDEPLLAAGYPLGTDLKGRATITKGNYVSFRTQRTSPVGYVQTNISLVEGMSGGPLVDQCGEAVGINTQGLAGLSLFITTSDAKKLIPDFTDQNIKKITADPSTPEGAVQAYYTYLKARDMEKGYDLLSEAYLQKTNFTEWTNRFDNILDVEVFGTKMEDEKTNTVFIKFGTKNWVNEEAEYHEYEGIWQTVLEDGVYKMYKSNIKEVESPSFDWYYEI